MISLDLIGWRNVLTTMHLLLFNAKYFVPSYNALLNNVLKYILNPKHEWVDLTLIIELLYHSWNFEFLKILQLFTTSRLVYIPNQEVKKYSEKISWN
jgi:hypothetical protein